MGKHVKYFLIFSLRCGIHVCKDPVEKIIAAPAIPLTVP